MSTFRTPLELGLARYLGEFYAQLSADTPAMQEYVARGLSKSIAWAPGRMVDQLEGMLAEWRKNDNKGTPGGSAYLPVMILAMAKDYQPVPPDWGFSSGAAMDVMNPDDPHQRAYKIRLGYGDYRAQIAIIAPEAATAHSLAYQLNLYTNDVARRRFKFVHEFAGQQHEFSALLEQIDIASISQQLEQDNLTGLVADINIRATIPLFIAPGQGQPNDGKAAPAGFPVTGGVSIVGTSTGAQSAVWLDGDGHVQAGEALP